jgi:hypothetical protein
MPAGSSLVCRFLEIPCGDCDVLLNSAQFAAGIVLRHDAELEGGRPYLNHTVRYAADTILVFDLRARLHSIFAVPPVDTASIALLADASRFTDDHREAFRSFARTIPGDISAGRLCLRVGLGAALRLSSIPLREIRPVPAAIRDRCYDGGLLACRFEPAGRVQYLVDIETIVFNTFHGV